MTEPVRTVCPDSGHIPSTVMDGRDCEHCHRARCTAQAKGSGERCRKHPRAGSMVCAKHGAATGTRAAVAAARRVEEAALAKKLARATATYGMPREVDAGLALLEEVHRTAGHVAWLAQKVAALTEDQLVVMGAFGPSKNPMLAQYERERAHLAKVCADAVRCGLEARQVALAERLGEQVLTAMRGFAAELGHDPDDPRVVEAGAKHLRMVSG